MPNAIRCWPSPATNWFEGANLTLAQLAANRGGNEERKKQVLDWHSAMDPQNVVSDYYVDSPVGPQLAEYLADNPEGLQALANAPPHLRQQHLARLEGVIIATQNFAAQQAEQGQQWQSARRMTNAPPPIRPPRGGGAMPPSDIHQLASRGESADDYVKARRAMEKKRD